MENAASNLVMDDWILKHAWWQNFFDQLGVYLISQILELVFKNNLIKKFHWDYEQKSTE